MLLYACLHRKPRAFHLCQSLLFLCYRLGECLRVACATGVQVLEISWMTTTSTTDGDELDNDSYDGWR